jgi:hypothetical protein
LSGSFALCELVTDIEFSRAAKAEYFFVAGYVDELG